MKDYAKKNYKQRNRKSRLPLFFLIGAVIIIVIYSVHFFKNRHSERPIIKEKPQVIESAKIKKPIKIIPKTITPPITDNSAAPDFDFSFYKILPKMNVMTPKVQTPVQQTSITEQKQYFLQVASSKNKSGADILTKQLTEYGFPTSMTTTLRKNTRWYHVFLGPYAYLNQAKTDQYRLYRDFHMNGILRIVNDKTK